MLQMLALGFDAVAPRLATPCGGRSVRSAFARRKFEGGHRSGVWTENEVAT